MKLVSMEEASEAIETSLTSPGVVSSVERRACCSFLSLRRMNSSRLILLRGEPENTLGNKSSSSLVGILYINISIYSTMGRSSKRILLHANSSGDISNRRIVRKTSPASRLYLFVSWDGATRLARIFAVSGFFSGLLRSEKGGWCSREGLRWAELVLQSLSEVELSECFFEVRPELVARLTISSKLNGFELPAVSSANDKGKRSKSIHGKPNDDVIFVRTCNGCATFFDGSCGLLTAFATVRIRRCRYS